MKSKSLPVVLVCVAALAASLTAQTAKTVLGTVTEFKPNGFGMGVKTDAGAPLIVPFSPDTQVVQIPPGEKDLTRSTPVGVTDILAGDRVMVSFVAGMPEARRIVLITSRDIVKRNEAEKLDWKIRGISGTVKSQAGSAVTLEIRTPEGAHTAQLTVTETTKIRRYAPDSVKFNEAIPARLADISPGDQVRARGQKNADDTTLAAEELVFGTFLTRLGPITAIHSETGEIVIQELTTQKPLTIHFTADSKMKMMPDMRAMLFGKPGQSSHDPAPAPPGEKGFDLQATMERLPVARIEDLKVGSSIIVTSTKGSSPDAITAIMLLANADFLVKMATAPASAEGGMDLSKLHGGMLVSPTGGFALPTMLQ